MPNLRIISDNAADRATITASSAAGALVASNLQKDAKSSVWRSSESLVNLTYTPNDFTDGSWVKRGSLTITPNTGMDASGALTMDRLSGLGDGGVNDIYQIGLAAARPNSPLVLSFAIRKISAIGTLAVSSANVAGGGYWLINLALVGWGLEIIARDHPAVTISQEFKCGYAGENGLNFYVTSGGPLTLELGAISNRLAPGAQINLAWPAAETLSALALPFCNLSPSATMRVRVSSESAKVNFATHSEQFDNAAWAKVSAGTASTPVVTANYAAAPDGTQTADRIVFSRTGATSGDYSLAYQTPTGASSGSQYSAGLWVKSNTGANQNLLLYGFSTRALVVVTSTWQRFSFADISPSTDFQLVFGTRGGSTAPFFGGDTSLDISVWGGQIEQGAISSYYPTITAATTRPAGYIDSWQSYDYDSGDTPACPAAAIALRGWTAAQAASAYAYGGGSCARMWFAERSVRGMAINITDTGSLQGYLEASRLVAGPYWSPTYNADNGASVTPNDMSTPYRTDAGDRKSDGAPSFRKMKLSLSYMPAADRTALFSILRANGTTHPMLVSVFPESADAELERDHTIYGYLSTASEMLITNFNAYSNSVELEEV